MSLDIFPDLQPYIERISNILATDLATIALVNQVIENQLPIPSVPFNGPDPPYIFVTESKTPIIQTKTVGKDDLNASGPEAVTMEFYIVVLAQDTTRQKAEALVNRIVSAAGTALKKNKRLLEPTTQNDPMAVDIEIELSPYMFDITNNETLAKNIVLRVPVGVNLRP